MRSFCNFPSIECVIVSIYYDFTLSKYSNFNDNLI